MALSLQLPILAEKVLTYAYDPNLVSYEPRTDLIAVVNDQNEVEIYRLGGQHVLTHKRKARSDTITCIQWIYDGSITSTRPPLYIHSPMTQDIKLP